MAWIERVDERGQRSRIYENSETGQRHQTLTLSSLHYESEPDSGVYDATLDLTPVRVDVPAFDGWRVTASGWHYALGKDLANHGDQDGWVGFGGRQGAHWFKFRLARVGYLHWPTRDWRDLGGPPTYDRARLSQEARTVNVGPNDDQVAVETVATWGRIWNTPGGGEVSVSWRANGDRLKEEVTVNQVAREWVEDHPPTTPANETWFGFVYQIDWADVPKVIRQGIQQDINGDWADDGQAIELRDAAGRLLTFMPVGNVWAGDDLEGAPLRKRFYRDGDNYYLLVGARVDTLAGLPAGDLVFDPTENMQVGASSDDAEQGDATMLLTGVYIRWYQGSTCHGGFRFVPLASIPQGSTITTATFSYKYTDTSFDTLTASVWADDSAGPGTFTTADNNISGRTPTTATVSINDTDVGVDWQTLDVQSIVQELATSYTVTAIAIIAYDSSSDSARWTTYDGDTANCPKLDVEYTTGAGISIPVVMHHLRQQRIA